MEGVRGAFSYLIEELVTEGGDLGRVAALNVNIGVRKGKWTTAQPRVLLRGEF